MVTEKISLRDYLNDFMPSFSNFISKCPLKIKSSVVSDTGVLYVEIQNSQGKSIDGFNYTVDPNVDKRVQIREIKEKLETFYPIIYQEQDEMYSAEEIESKVNSGMPLVEALKMRKHTTTKKYKIIRAHHKYNELDCMELETGKMLKFKLKFKEFHTPTATFLDRLNDNPTSQSKYFFDAFEFKYNLR